MDDKGDVSTSADDKCTRTWYAPDAAGNPLPTPRRVQEVSVSCSATPDYTKDLLSDDLTFFDGSTDNTADVVRLYAGDARIRAFRTPGVGLPAVCNLALREARGEYVMRVVYPFQPTQGLLASTLAGSM